MIELAALWLGTLADHYTTRRALKRGGREGNPAGIGWATWAKVPVLICCTCGFFFTDPGTVPHDAWATASAILGGWFFLHAAWNWRQQR